MRGARFTAALFSSALLLGLTPLPANATYFVVDITNFAFTPDRLDISTQGVTTKWHNSSGATHTSTADGPFTLWATGNITAGTDSAPVAMNWAGTYTYHCSIHTSMHGTLKIPLGASALSTTAGGSIDLHPAQPGSIPVGFKMQLQLRRNGGAWKTIDTGRMTTVPRTFGRAGAWELHGRMIKGGSGQVSKWSPLLDISVT